MYYLEVKHIRDYKGEIMSRETLKNLIELVPNDDIDVLYRVIVKFIPEDTPTLEEIKAIEDANKSIAEHGTVPHDAIDWD